MLDNGFLHLTFRSCVGDSVGTECPVCHMPAWVQDAQINRQLDNVIQLCSKLRHLLGADTSGKSKPESLTASKKKQLKMWFSPRSRKIRCVLNKSQPETKSDDLCLDTSSIYDFFPSPPHEKPTKPTKKPTESKKMKKKRLSDINKVWSLEKPEREGGVEKTPKEKCVTICSQLVALCAPEPNSPEKTFQQESMKEADSSKNMENVEVLPQVKSSEKKDSSEVACPVQVSKEKNCARETSVSTENETTSYKRGREQSRFPFTSQSKRPRRTERAIIGKSGRQADCLEELPQGCPTSPATEHKTPVQISSSVSKLTDTVMKTRSSTCDRIGIPHSPSVLKSPGGNTIARRNYKGETLLHVASIKGDLAAVQQLLKNGADPNVKDNAGWTPLHEACNHGHKEVVELLLQYKALVNTTGYQNDSPLHDAAKNGHVSIVELLLLHGASRDAVEEVGVKCMFHYTCILLFQVGLSVLLCPKLF
uniref:BARD1 Zinc finger RING-type domain-containing protein n=1 Tax=Accipiter nisus TaxID=211598 RepID=A0A8B9RZ03_9AVES